MIYLSIGKVFLLSGKGDPLYSLRQSAQIIHLLRTGIFLIISTTHRDAKYTNKASTGTDIIAGNILVFIFNRLSAMLKKSWTRYIPRLQLARRVIYRLFLYLCSHSLLLMVFFASTKIKNAKIIVCGPIFSKYWVLPLNSTIPQYVEVPNIYTMLSIPMVYSIFFCKELRSYLEKKYPARKYPVYEYKSYTPKLICTL